MHKSLAFLAIAALGATVIVQIYFISKGQYHWRLSAENFESVPAKILFDLVVLALGVGLVGNFLGMVWDMVRNHEWKWLIGAALCIFLATVAYYFQVYRYRGEPDA